MRRYLLLFCLGVLLAVPLAFVRVDDPRDAIYVPSPPEVVDKMLELADIRPDDVIYDLGCGDGRIPIAAAQKFGGRAFGYDIDPVRVRESRENAAKADVERLVTFEQADIFGLDLSGADVVMLYLGAKLNVRLIPQLEKLKPGSRIVSHDFDMRGVTPQQVVTVKRAGARDRVVYLWTTPLVKQPE